MDLDIDFLKYLVVNGSLFEAAVALAILDEMTDGKVMEFYEKYCAPSQVKKPVRVRQGAKAVRRW